MVIQQTNANRKDTTVSMHKVVKIRDTILIIGGDPVKVYEQDIIAECIYVFLTAIS